MNYSEYSQCQIVLYRKPVQNLGNFTKKAIPARNIPVKTEKYKQFINVLPITVNAFKVNIQQHIMKRSSFFTANFEQTK